MLPPVGPAAAAAADLLCDLFQAVVAPVAAPVLAVLAAALPWYCRHCLKAHYPVVCVSVDEPLVPEMVDEVTVHMHLLGAVVIVHEVVADVLHPYDEVGALIPAGGRSRFEGVVVAEP